tara:strand:- start:1496 stop:1876 length:381 start_codon:yes stop_codon:yes gene_type:complete
MEDQIRQANQSFYEAFNKQDLAKMGKIWGQNAHCIHPGWPVLRGHGPILKSWSEIFENTDNLEIKLSEVEINTNDDFAWVSCQENLFSIHSSGVQASKVHATNLFKKIDGQWKIIQHHASTLPGVE